MFLSGKQGSSLEHKHMLLKLVALEWLGIPVGLHSGNLLTMTKQTNLKNWRLLEAWEIYKCKSPLNHDDGMYTPQEYRALTLLDKK